MSSTMPLAEARSLVDSVSTWYHRMELMPGLVTPGGFDVQSVVDRLPWPDVKGKRCLDVGTFDGFLAFELERRGASEVVATDIPDHRNWDWPRPERSGMDAMERDVAQQGRGFKVASEILGSKVDRRIINIYDLSPETVGAFDVVVLGDLLLHLRDPLRALEAIRSVCTGYFMSTELLDTWLTLMHPRYPAATVYLGKGPIQWQVPNAMAHRRQLIASGFGIDKAVRYAIPTSIVTTRPPGLRGLARSAVNRIVAKGPGAARQALLAHPVH